MTLIHNKRKHYFLGGLLILLLLLGLVGTFLHMNTYQPTSSAKQASQHATVTKNVTTFKAKNSKLTLVFYTVGLSTDTVGIRRGIRGGMYAVVILL